MKRSLILFGLIAAAATVSWAQTATRLERLQIAIWPEYDQPAMLVMYRGWIPIDEPLPSTVTFPIPAAVEVPNAVAKRGPGTDLLVAPYTVETAGDWNRLHLQTDLPEIRLEFYLDLDTTQEQRSFTLHWPGGPAIADLSYEVMQPTGARDFSVTPGSGTSAVGPDGLNYFVEQLGSVPAGGEFFIEISYTKTDPALTISAMQPVSPQPQQALPLNPPPAQSRTSQPEPETAGAESIWQVVIPVLILAAIGTAWILISTRRKPH